MPLIGKWQLAKFKLEIGNFIFIGYKDPDSYQNGELIVSHLVSGGRIGVVLFDDTVDPLEIGFALSQFSFRLSAHRGIFPFDYVALR